MTAYQLDDFGYPQPIKRSGRDKSGLSTTRRRTIRHRQTIELGRHPLTGARLLDPAWGYTCRDCVHAFRYRPGNRTVWKCSISFRAARGSSEATDLRVGWPACALFRLEQEIPDA